VDGGVYTGKISREDIAEIAVTALNDPGKCGVGVGMVI